MPLIIAETDFNSMVVAVVVPFLTLLTLIVNAVIAVWVARQGKAVAAVTTAQEEVKKTLAAQDVKTAEQGATLAVVAKQTDGLMTKFGDAKLDQGKHLGAEEQRMKQVEIDLAVADAVTKVDSGIHKTAPIPVDVVNATVPVTETNPIK